MDEYGCFKLSDVPELCEHLKQDGIVTFPCTGDNFTAFILTIAGPIKQIGVMPLGGGVHGTYLVAIRRRGSDYFDFESKNRLHPDYISEKFGIGTSDSHVIAELLNAFKSEFRKKGEEI